MRDAGASLRRGGGDGLLVAVLGTVEPEEAHLLARLRQGSTAAIAILLDTASWMAPSDHARAASHAQFEGSAALLRASGWRVVAARAGESLTDLWPDAAHHGGGWAPSVVASGTSGARS